ncbi:MAG: dTMP kinase [Fimbriiglobus sp.]|jgi:dTMP kinase|nr:dTMP kinase [Fimbriiglobus sp.]
MPLSHRSAFISLDGIDGTGKSTQLALLAEKLRSLGHTVTTCVDPGGTEIGARLREILLYGRQTQMSLRAEALMFMASRAELVDKVIRPALARGEVVLADRYLLANVVYQGHAGGLDPTDLWAVGRFSTGALDPDLTLVLDLPVEVARTRRKPSAADRVESRGDWYFNRVREGFLFEVHNWPDRMRVIDASGTVEDVQAAVFAEVRDLLERRLKSTPGPRA